MVKMHGIHADQYITDDGQTRYGVAIILVSNPDFRLNNSLKFRLDSIRFFILTLKMEELNGFVR